MPGRATRRRAAVRAMSSGLLGSAIMRPTWSPAKPQAAQVNHQAAGWRWSGVARRAPARSQWAQRVRPSGPGGQDRPRASATRATGKYSNASRGCAIMADATPAGPAADPVGMRTLLLLTRLGAPEQIKRAALDGGRDWKDLPPVCYADAGRSYPVHTPV